ncbi:protein-S-isoprenylcysteine O-methyltransferase [Methanotrichaceae archaeon M04Ac]|uniref:Protein-S-isoprenylcysteine O-methyltransferase n=1 Tax=Candidatus Methanocrinis alkalitolerans TaxID=3033395 RepID=A0ABT5XCF5_9EURY|nr:protein-S-isoprenylcysteine O-methyltransferase [Candidatus Methanocrinis alkalitolerans]MCR3882819.1 protein-S-isoprenylcysteine O-methyltransferase [Methanothrix sp.]MDF0592333.1 protein-S-isoprenylcysteine O-methyltransferase [Candidatus Methanocrinis alkalitolerans]
MLDDLFDLVFLAGFLAASLIRVYWLKKTPSWWREPTEVADSRERKQDRPLMLLTAAGMIVVPFLYLFTSRLDFADYTLPETASLVAGSLGGALFLQALLLLWRSHADLAGSFSPGLQIRKNHRLVTTGVYERVRHPMYAAHLLWAAAQLLLLHNWIAGPAFLVASLPLYAARIPREEEMMEEKFGEEYRRYAERTGRVVPRWRRG